MSARLTQYYKNEEGEMADMSVKIQESGPSDIQHYTSSKHKKIWKVVLRVSNDEE